MIKFIKFTIDWFVRKLNKDQVDAFSAQSAFFIIIAFFPFLILLMSLLNLININGQSLIGYVISLLPKDIENMISTMMYVQYQPVTILSVAGFACLWSASKATLAIIKGLRSVFNVETKVNYVRLRVMSILYTFGFLIVLSLTAIVLVFGNGLYYFLTSSLVPGFASSIFDYKYILVFVLLSSFFTLTYKVVAIRTKTPLKYCAIGASIAALGWMVFSFFFAVFIENFSNYANMYGSFAALIIFMLWLYICMYIMLIGAEISVFIYKEKLLKRETFERFKT